MNSDSWHSELLGRIVTAVANAARNGLCNVTYDYNAMPITHLDILMLVNMFGRYGNSCSIMFKPDNTVTICWGNLGI